MSSQARGREALPWQQEAFDRLWALHVAGRLGHAWLLQGPEGVGKRSFARRFSQALLCRAPRDGAPCGECKACRLVFADTHPDLKVVEPGEKGNIKVEQVREMLEFMGKTPSQGSRKALILAPAEAMNLNAANALLKGLEEASQGSVLLLVSHHPALLPATVRSRCQALRFALPDPGQSLDWLAARNVSGQPSVLLRLANGAPLRALALADEDAQHERGVLHETLLRLLRREVTPPEAALACKDFSLDSNIEGMMLCLGDLLRHLQSGGAEALRDPDLAPLAGGLIKMSPSGEAGFPGLARRLHGLRRQLLEARRAVTAKVNPNPQLLLESLFHSWTNLDKLE